MQVNNRIKSMCKMRTVYHKTFVSNGEKEPKNNKLLKIRHLDRTEFRHGQLSCIPD